MEKERKPPLLQQYTNKQTQENIRSAKDPHLQQNAFPSRAVMSRRHLCS